MERGEIINWLKSGDSVITYLVDKYLYNQGVKHQDLGYIDRYLSLFNQETSEWGGGIYSPLWTSSHYTLLELKYMEISYNHPFYQNATLKLLEGLWFNQGKISKRRYQDMCMSAMLLSIVSYGKIISSKTTEIVDYILNHQMSDGGWNCAWDSTSNKSSKSSFHTTISVLEAFLDFSKYDNDYRHNDIMSAAKRAEEYLLDRKLMFSLSKEKIVDDKFLEFHYPVRYKYDCFRALEYFVDKDYKYDSRMNSALQILKDKLDNGPILVGNQYSGKRHFRLETTLYGRFNTFRALKIIKKYAPDLFSEYIMDS